jgi:preprotein translocase subunit YajC
MMSISPLFLAQAAQQPPSMAGMFVPMICIFAVMYFLMIRPQQQKQKKLQETIDSLKTGDAVITTGGIHGVVSNVKDGSTLSLKIADNVRIDVEKSAIATVLKQDGSAKA